MRRSPKDYCTRSKQYMKAHRQGKVNCCSCLQCLAVLRLIVERSRRSQPGRETSGGLPVQYVYVCLDVQPGQRATVTEDCAIREQGSVDGEHLAPGQLTRSGV